MTEDTRPPLRSGPQADGLPAQELLPCPFCGGEAFHIGAEGSHVHIIGCDDCDACTGDHPSQVAAFAAWNTRP